MKKILITEDDPALQEIFRMILEKEGYEVLIQSNGDSILQNQFMLPDLFLLDKQLAGMDGTDLCRFLKSQQKTKNIPVIMISANPGIKEMSKQAGADAYIEKPFAKSDFLKTIADTVNAH